MPTYFTHLTTRETALLLRMSMRALERWRAVGEGPPYSRFGRAIRYDRGHLNDGLTSVGAMQRTGVGRFDEDLEVPGPNAIPTIGFLVSLRCHSNPLVAVIQRGEQSEPGQHHEPRGGRRNCGKTRD